METLYRKYRPKNFDEVEGQTHIVRTLRNTIAMDRIGHAYLFSGPRGTGKTTIARIFSLAINCGKPKKGNPCGVCKHCATAFSGPSLDTIEIDAASHTGVDNIRQLRDEAALPPLDGARRKIYIIDEAHMLSKGAFNALLKILEEPPKHIVFILATTEIHKVPETILSRCQQFDFGHIPVRRIIEKLSRIAKSEGVAIEEKALEMIAVAASGGMRDAESLLSQLFSANDKHITEQEAEEILGFSHQRTSREFAAALTQNDITASLRCIQEAAENGYDLDHFVETVLLILRRLLLLRVSPDSSKELKYETTPEELQELEIRAASLTPSWIVRAIDTLLAARIAMKSSFMAQIPLETATVKILDTSLLQTSSHFPAAAPAQTTQTETPRTSSVKHESPEKESKIKTNNPPASLPADPKKTPKKKIEKSEDAKNTEKPEKSILTLEDVQSVWNKCARETKAKNTLLGTFLEASFPDSIEKDSIRICVPSEFHKTKLENKTNRLTIESILGTLLQGKITIFADVRQEEKPSDPLLQTVMETFGETVA